MDWAMQALFNYFSCSAVAIATVVGGSNPSLVTALMIAAHMVRTAGLPVLFSIMAFSAGYACISIC